MNLIRLGRLTSNPGFEEKAFQIGNFFAGQINAVPQGYSQFLTALLFASGPSYEVVIAGDKDAQDTREMIKKLQGHYSPNTVLLFRPPEAPWLFKTIPVLEHQTALNGKATAYVCQDFQCSAPTSDLDEMISLLENR
jgi:uncharacterized protein